MSTPSNAHRAPHPHFSFADRTALITGAASGIGAATAQFLSDAGAKRLILIDMDASGLEALSLNCPVSNFAGDVGDPVLWEEISADLTGLDHAVLNAGIAGGGTPILEMGWEKWQRTVSTNLNGVFLGLKTAMQAMTEKETAQAEDAADTPHLRGGSVVITASVAAVRGVSSIDYGATKSAAAHMARIAGREGGPMGIRVNAIAPGGVDTPIWDTTEGFRNFVEKVGDRAEAIEQFGKIDCPIGRFATRQEIAGQIAFLLSDMAATITGEVLVSDGGFSI